jgi:hypothetical protein
VDNTAAMPQFSHGAAAGAVGKDQRLTAFPTDPTPKGGMRMAASTMTKESVRALIDAVENDPLAGLGCYTKKDLLVDRFLAHSRATMPSTVPISTPRPVLSEPSRSDEEAA